MDERCDGITRPSGMSSWRAGCDESRTSGSEGGPRKRTGRKVGTAPRPDPYTKLRGPAKWTWFYLYVILDVFSRYVPGWMIAARESAALAAHLIADTVEKEDVVPGQLTIHADRGTSMRSKPVALLLADLGVERTHSRPHVSNDNPSSESQFRTLKYRPTFPARFGSLEDARAFCLEFFGWSRYAGDTEARRSRGRGRRQRSDRGSAWASCRAWFERPVMAAAS